MKDYTAREWVRLLLQFWDPSVQPLSRSWIVLAGKYRGLSPS